MLDAFEKQVREADGQRILSDGIFEVSEFQNLNIPERQSIVAPWLKDESITLISGPRGVGKSMLAIALVEAITKKTSFGPWGVETSVPCLYLDGEMPVSDIKERFHSFDNSLPRRSPLYIYSDHFASTLGLPRANLLNPEWQRQIKSYLLERNVRFWMIDNLASLAPGIDENQKREWDPINQFLLELRFSGIATGMVHHTGKDGFQRGTSAREDNIDTSIMLKIPPGYVKEDGCSFIVAFTKARVSHKDISAVSDYHFKLVDDGHYSWQWGNVRREIRMEVLQMLHHGEDYNSICEALAITKGYISRIKKAAIEDGHLDKKGKLTAAGWLLVDGQN